MKINSQQQLELDTIEKQILIFLFGQEVIPNTSATLLSIAGINPNSLINEFETKLSPFMNENGTINGDFIKKMLLITPKFRKFESIINTFPSDDFYLSSKIYDIIKIFFPGVKNEITKF